jgi:hypothetical protein
MNAHAAIAESRKTSLLDRLDEIVAMDDAALVAKAVELAAFLLDTGELALENWLASRGRTPDGSLVEGFRLLALHRQGARGDPSFNACRESCRELVYHVNCAGMLSGAEVARALRMGAMVARHIVLFIDGKLENTGLGEFCCSSRPLRSGEDAGVAETLDLEN